MNNNFSQRKLAIISGISLLVMAITAGFTYGFIHGNLIVESNMLLTSQNILTSSGLFRLEIFGWSFIILLDIIVAWSLYLYFKEVNSSLSLLGGWFRLVYSIILGIALQNLVAIFPIIKMGESFPGQIFLLTSTFNDTWILGLILFGFHLLIIGILALKSLNKIISILLIIAAASYIIINSAYSFIPQFDNVTKSLETILIIPMTVGELGFGIWLLIKGGR